MDDKPEDKDPKPKAKTGGRASPKSATVAPAAKTKARSGSAKRTKPADASAPRKAPAKRAAVKPAAGQQGKAASAAAKQPAGKKPAAKKARAPAKAKQPGQMAGVAAPEPPLAAPAELLPARPLDEASAGDVTIHPVKPHVPTVHPHDEGLEFGLSPVDLAPDAGVREEAGLGWFIRILAFSSVLLVLFNSFAIDKWAREQPVTKWNSQVLIAAHRLHAEMKDFHLDAPLEGMRSIWHGIRAAQWPGSAGAGSRSTEGKPPAQ